MGCELIRNPFLFFFTKTLDIYARRCYNRIKEREVIKMKYRVVHPKYFPAYFYRKSDAVAYAEKCGGEVERKIGGNWFKY